MDTMIARVRDVHASQDWSTLEDLSSWVVREALNIQQVPAPTFHERQRAQYIHERFSELPLVDVETDEVNNVYGRFKGEKRDAALLIMAHTDTVFPADTDLSVTRGVSKISGPGIGDNSLGVAALLGLAKSYLNQRASPPVTSGWLPIAAKRVWATCAGPRQPSPSCNPVSTQ